MAKVNVDNDMIEARKTFVTLAKAPGGLSMWAEAEHDTSDEVTKLRLVLNDFELVSVAMQFGIMDYDFYCLQSRGTILKYWEAAAPLVHALRQRTGRKTIFREFEQLASWVDQDLRPPRRRLWLRKHF